MSIKTTVATTITPPLLIVMGWVAYYSIDIVPQGVRLDRWTATPPTTGAPVDTTVWEARWYKTGENMWNIPVAIDEMDSVTFQIRVAGIDSLGRQGTWSEWGQF